MKKIQLLIIVMLVAALLPSLPASAEQPALEETSDYKKLAAFGIINEDDDMLYYKEISRGLFMTYIIRCLRNLSDIIDASKFASPFTDVSETSMGRDAIVLAEKLNIINGSGNDLFEPEENITMHEAAKILTVMLGYEDMAEQGGGYPSGYIAKASELRLFNGCSFTAEGYVTPECLVKMLMNTMNAKVIRIGAVWKKNGEYTKEYISVKDEIFLNYAFDIYRTSGILDSNEYTALDGVSRAGSGKITIDGQIYETSESNAADLLGYNVECYYHYDKSNDSESVVYIEPYAGRNSVVSVNSKDIADAETSIESFVYYTENEDKKETVKISKAAVMIYNGRQKRISKEALCPQCGAVTLIDNDSDDIADIVSVMSYRTILVSGKSASSYTVTDILGGEPIELDPTESEYTVFLTKNGQPILFESISTRNVISYAESEGSGRNIKYAVVSDAATSGTVQAIGEKTAVIEGVEYPVDSELVKKLSVGEEGTFYIDFTGRIVARKGEKDVVYGYLNKLHSESLGSVQAQIFTENNRWVILDFNEKFRFGDTSGYSADNFYKYCMDNFEDYRQLVTYTVDADGKINQMNFARQFEEYSPEEENAIEQNIFRLSHVSSSESYRSTIKSFGNSILLTDETKIFMIPKQAPGEEAELSEFYIMSTASLIADKSYKNISGYDMSKTRQAKACVLLGNEISVNNNSNIMIVNNIVKAVNDDGEVVDAVKGVYKGAEIIVFTKDSTIIGGMDTLGKGDVIQFSLDSDGNVRSVELRYDYIGGAAQNFVINNLYSNGTFVGGTVYYADAENSKIVISSGETKIISGTNSSTSVYVYDTESKKVIKGGFEDIEKGKNIFVRMCYYMANEIVVYR